MSLPRLRSTSRMQCLMSSFQVPADRDAGEVANLDHGMQATAIRRLPSLADYHARLSGTRLPAYQHAVPRRAPRGWSAASRQIERLEQVWRTRRVPAIDTLAARLRSKRVLSLLLPLGALLLIVLVTL